LRQSTNAVFRGVAAAQAPDLKERPLALSTEDGKNYSLIQKARRENVTEMILEPIAGLQEEDYDSEMIKTF
jgi:hypothetical protein